MSLPKWFQEAVGKGQDLSACLELWRHATTVERDERAAQREEKKHEAEQKRIAMEMEAEQRRIAMEKEAEQKRIAMEQEAEQRKLDLEKEMQEKKLNLERERGKKVTGKNERIRFTGTGIEGQGQTK
jgi:hypothetical protein